MLKIGDKVFIRTVTFYHVGIIEDMDDKFIKLAKGTVYVACTGGFKSFLVGEFTDSTEFSVINSSPTMLNIESITDWYYYHADLPTEDKKAVD